MLAKSLDARHVFVGIDPLPQHQVQLLALEELACVFETGLVQVSNQFLQGGPHEVHRVHELQPVVNLLSVVFDDCVHQDVLVEGDVLFLVAGDAVNVTRRVAKPLHEETTVIPGQVVEKHRDGRRSFQPEVTLRVEGASVLAGVVAVIAHLSHVYLVIVIITKLLKDSAEIIAESLTVIFNKSIETGIFPDDLKVSCISPIHKGESKTECSNYRPISVIPVVAKVFEKLVSGQFMEYLESNHLLSESQAGFRKRSSTVTSLLSNTNQWYINMDKGLVNGIIFLDLKKAFDCVDHNILTEKLMKFGCIGNTLNWFKSYLTNRKQMCKVNQTTSKSRTISCGVPQGSNLGPILFLLYVNDLPNCLKSTSASMFADDTNLTASGNTITELHNKLNNDLENIHQWLLANKLTLNTSKTEYMMVGSRQKLGKGEDDTHIKLGDNKIKKVKETKTLGVIVDDQLKWNSHINTVFTKVSKGIGMIRRMKAFVPQSTLISVYNAIILPHFDYCSLVWDIGNAYSLEKLQKMQNRAARVITGKSYDVRSKDILQELSWQPLMERWGNNKAIFMHKVANGEYLEKISNLFVVKNNDNYNLRNNGIDYTLEKPRTNFLKKSISYCGAKMWNELPVELKANSLSLNTFKTLLRDRSRLNS